MTQALYVSNDENTAYANNKKGKKQNMHTINKKYLSVFISLFLINLILVGCKNADIEGVIKDPKTGLWWAQDAGVPPMNLSQAKDYVRNLKLGGYNDWMLPSHDELQVLLKYDNTTNEGPDKLRNMGFINVRSTCYWTDPGDEKDIGFYIAGAGGSYMMSGGIDISANCNVWPVRTGKGVKEYDEAKGSRLFSSSDREIKRDERFIAFDNETVLDTRTDLMWAAKDNGKSLNWQNGKTYCKNFRGGGYTDWRMPTQDELAGLYDRRKSYEVKRPSSYIFKVHVHLTELIKLSDGSLWASDASGSGFAGFSFENSGSRTWCRQPCAVTDRVLPVRSSR